MPDNNIPSDVITGQNSSTLLAAGQDTQVAANDILQNNPRQFVNPNSIEQPEVPKGLYGTVNPGENINADKTSYDYNANFYNQSEQVLKNQYPGNSKLPDILMPQSETSRFTGNDYGFDINRNNETFYADHQGFGKMAANSLVNLVGKTAAYITQNAGFILGAPVAVATQNISNLTDNFLTRTGDWLKDKVSAAFPIYKSDQYQNGSIWGKLGTAGWWLDDGMDRAALTLAMLAPGMAETKGLGLFGTAVDEAGALRTTGLISKAVKTIASNPDTYGRYLTNAELTAWNIIGQSGLNGKETQEAVLKATGDKDKAAAAASKSFWETVPITLLGSLAEIPQMFSTVSTAKYALNKLFNPQTGEAVEGALDFSKSVGKTIRNSLLTGLEHGQNESLQVAISRYNEDSNTEDPKNPGHMKDTRGLIPGIIGDWIDNIHDTNGQNNIALGTIQGMLMTIGGIAKDKYITHDTAKEEARAKDVYAQIVQAKLARSYYNGDFNQRDEQGKLVLDEKGDPIPDPQKMANIGMSLIGLQNNLELKKKALDAGNYTLAAYIDHQMLAGFAQNFFSDPAGMKHLSSLLKLESQNSEDNPNRVNDYDGTGIEITPQVQLQKNLNTVKDLKKAHDLINNNVETFRNLGVDQKNKAEVQEANEFVNDFRNAQYVQSAAQLFYKSEIAKNQAEIDSLGVEPDSKEGEISHVSKPSSPSEVRFNELHSINANLNEKLSESKELYKNLIDKKLQKDAWNERKTEVTKIDELKEEQDKKNSIKDKLVQAKDVVVDTISKAFGGKSTETTTDQPGTTMSDEDALNHLVATNEDPNAGTQTTTTNPVSTPVQQQQAQPVNDKAAQLKALTDKRDQDLANAKTEDEKATINKKYIQDRLTLSKTDSKKTPEQQDARFHEIKNLIPNTPTIHVDEQGKMAKLINDEAKEGNIDDLHEAMLINALDQKKVIGTILNSSDDNEETIPDQGEEKETPEQKAEDQNLDEKILSETAPTTDEQSELGNSPNEYNPDTSDVEDHVSSDDSMSFVAFMSSNKTITQEELQSPTGQYTGNLDEDPYKQFKQGYFRHVVQNGMPDEGLHAKIVKDSNEFPHSEETKSHLAVGNSYGSVMVMTNEDRNILYFDENYNSTTEPGKEGHKPLVYSFNSMAWGKNEAFRALIGENRTGKSFEDYIKQYEAEQEQQRLARELTAQGKEVHVDIAHITHGVINKAKTPIKSSDVVTEDMDSNLFIPSLQAAFNSENPTAKKYVIVGSEALVNGGLYAQVIDKQSGLSSYVRLIPNTISEIPELVKNVTDLLTHHYDDENEASSARDYLKDILFLNKVKRPEARVVEAENGKYVISLISDRITMTPEVAVTFAMQQRLNIPKANVESDEHLYAQIKDGKLDINVGQNYKQLVLANSTTRSIPIKTSEGNRFMGLNSYAIFNFLQSADSMRGALGKKQKAAPPGERVMTFKENETPVFRHADNPEERQSLNSGHNNIALDKEGISQSQQLGEKLDKLGIKSLIASPILRAMQTAREALKQISGNKSVEKSDRLRTWDIGDYTSKPDAIFDEAYFVTHPDATEKDGMKLGESFNTFLKRALKAYKYFKESTLPNTAIITHSKVIRVWDAYKENNELWNDSASERYLNLPSSFAFTSIARKDVKSDNSTITNNPLRRLSPTKTQESDAERLAREQHEREKGLKAKVDTREDRAFIKDSEIKRVNEIFGPGTAQRINDIVNSDARALWTTSGIKLYRDAREGDGYHEAWHHFSQLYLTQADKRSLYDEARKKAFNFTDRDGRELNSKTASDFDLEEFIADDFRDYVNSEGKSRMVDRPYRNTIFRKILDFLKKFFFGEVNVAKLYDDLYKGNLNSYEPSINNAMWGKLNSKAVNQKGDEIINNQKAVYFRGVVDYFMGDQLLKANASVDMLNRNKTLAQAIYENIYNELVKNHFNPLLDKADKGEEIDQTLAEDLYKILSNWEDFVQYHKEESKLFLKIPHELAIDVPENPEDYTADTEAGEDQVELTGDNEEMTDESSEEHEAEFSDKMYDRAGNEESSMAAASVQTKGLIRMLPEVEYNNGTFTVKVDRNGFPKLCDYAKTWNNLAYNLANISKYEDMYDKMTDPDVMKKIPELSVLIKHLPSPDIEHNYAEFKTVTAFRTDFNRSYVGIYSGRIYPQEDGSISYFLNEETKRNTAAVSRLWTVNFNNKLNTSSEVSSGRIITDTETGKYYINPAIRLNYEMKNKNQREQFINFLGFSFSDDVKKQQFYNNALPQLLKNIQDNINLRNEGNYRIYNPVFDLRTDIRDDKTGKIIIPGLRKTIDSLIQIEAKYSSDVPSLSYQTAEGEMIYGLSLNHTLSLVTNALNRAKSYDDIRNDPATQNLNWTNNPYVRGSIFLEHMFDMKTGERKNRNIVVGNYNGLKTEDKNGNTVGFSTTNLNVRQKAIFDINSLLTKGVIEVMRTESSKSAYFIKLDSYVNQGGDVSRSYLPVGISEFTSSFNSPTFKRHMIDGYLYDELYRMKTAKDIDIFKKDPKLMAAASGFNLFSDILNSTKEGKPNEDLKNTLRSEIENHDVSAVIQKHRAAIENAIEGFFVNELKSFKEGLEQENIGADDIAKAIPGENLDQKYRAFLANDFLLNVEYTKLFNGDTIYQAHYKDYFKRSKGDVSTGLTPITDDLFARFMKNGERNTFGGFMKDSAENNYKTTKTVNFVDDERSSKYLEIYKKDLKAVNPKISEEDLNKYLDKYSKLNIGDGQGWITMDFYRQFLRSINNWSDDQEMMYKVELAKWRLAHAAFNPDYTNEMKQTDREFLNQNPQTFSYFPPLKIQYNGPIAAVGTAAMVMDKFSVAPLIPSIIQGTPLEEVHNEMLKHGVGYAKFVSGTKKYKAPATSLYSEDGFKGVDLSKATLSTHFLPYLKEQIHTNPNIKRESIFGSQVRKLIEANIFSKGEARPIDLQRHEAYKSYIKGMIELGKAELFKDLSIGEKDGKMVINDVTKFISTLQAQADLRDLNDNIKDYIQYDKDTNKMKYPLETSLNRRAIQDLIMGVIDRRIRLQKLSGDQLIQISSSGFQDRDFKFRNATEDEVKKYGTNGLRFYHLDYDKDGKPVRTVKAQVKVALIGSFEKLLFKTHPDGKKIETIERLNELLKNDDWMKENSKSVSLVGYRIPTQGHNSIENLEVAEFLPPHAGSVVIVPAEIVAKAGSDFDIDKLSIFRPSFDDKGNLINDNSKEGYGNKIMSLFSDILSDPATFEKLIRPNDTDLIKPDINDIAVKLGKRSAKDIKDPQPYARTQVYRWKVNLRKFETLLSAKKLLGIFAVNNTFTTLLQQAGITMNSVYGVTNGPTRNVRMMLMSPSERKQVLKDGRYDLSSKYDVEGSLKQDYLNQMINATVDAASDDFAGYVNLSYENVGVLCLLVNQGVPFGRAMWFLNQPALLRYYSDLRRRGVNESKADIQARILGGLRDENYYYTTEEGLTKLDRPKLNKAINDILDSQAGQNIYLSKTVLQNTTVKINKVDEFLADDTKKTYNALVFAYFMSLQEQAQIFRGYQQLLNFDTTKTRSPLASWQAFRAIENLKQNRMFDENEYGKMVSKSVIGPFDNRVLIATIGARLMPVAFNPMFMRDVMPMVNKEIAYKNKNIQRRFINNFENQWIEYVVKSMSKIDGAPLQNYAKSLLEGRNNLARRFNDLISKYPDLKDNYAFVNRIRPNFPNKPDVKKSNLEVYRLFENSTDDQNRYISEFRELINLDDLRKYSVDQSKEIRKFFADMAILGFAQSGFSKSNISFQELVPHEQLADMFKTALQNLNKLVIQDSSLMAAYVKEYTQQYGNNNNAKNAQQWRGRDYYLSKKMEDAIIKKEGEVALIRSQVNTKSTPAPYENVVKTEIPKDATPKQVQKAEVKQEQEILDPQTTKRQYWPGEEVKESDDELKQALGKATFKFIMDDLANPDYRKFTFPNIPDNATDKDYENFVASGSEDVEELNNTNFERAYKLYSKFDDFAFQDEDGDEMSLDDLKDNLAKVILKDSDTEFPSLTRMFQAYQADEISPQDKDQVEKILSDYGLLRYRDFNPNQFRIPFEGVDAEEYNKQINQVLNDKDKGC
jgi:broad specificity phosphatase PhoE